MIFTFLLAFIAPSLTVAPATDFHSTAPTTTVEMQSGRSLVSTTPAKAPQKRWDGHFSSKDFSTSEEKVELKNIKKIIGTTLVSLPKEHTQALQSLEIRNKSHVSRGMANSKKMILHVGSVEDDQELAAVFTHEMGHVVDLGVLKGAHGSASKFTDNSQAILSDDLSVAFYELSWKNQDTRYKNASKNDFVSGYAMANAFEDFAESYIFYRLHGEKFRMATQKSKVLQAKYDFLKKFVFANEEFQLDKDMPATFVSGLIWDTTLLDF